MSNAKKTAINIAEDLKGIKDSDSLIHNIEQVASYVIDTLESVVGSKI